ncbi:unnamed protein product [Symbiodinium sp. CCMP2456]|nr:unnamed protein product [Symbiodinium sp. CCMP2456]
MALLLWFTQQRDGSHGGVQEPPNMERCPEESEDEPTHDPRPGSPPRGPPPPLPIQALQVPSQAASVALCDALGLNCQAVTHLPWDWSTQTAIAIHVRPMTPAERLHPNLIFCGESAETEAPAVVGRPAASHDARASSMTSGATEGAARATPAELRAALPDPEWDDLMAELELDQPEGDMIHAGDEAVRWAMTSSTLSSATAPPVPTPASGSTSPSPRSGKAKAKPRAQTPRATHRKREAYLAQLSVYDSTVAGQLRAMHQDKRRGMLASCHNCPGEDANLRSEREPATCRLKEAEEGHPDFDRKQLCHIDGTDVALRSLSVPERQPTVRPADQKAALSPLLLRRLTLPRQGLQPPTVTTPCMARSRMPSSRTMWRGSWSSLNCGTVYISASLARLLTHLITLGASFFFLLEAASTGQVTTTAGREVLTRPAIGLPTELSTTSRRSRLGPKSQGSSQKSRISMIVYVVLLIYLNMMNGVAATDVRVESAAHYRDSEASTQFIFRHGGAKPSATSHPDRSNHQHPPPTKKRALLRAITRAKANPTHQTWYRGRLLHLGQLQGGRKVQREHFKPHTPPAGPQPRLQILCWNTGGLNSVKCKEILIWLQQEHDRGHTYDICVLQETTWKEDAEFVTSSEDPKDLTWHAVHSAGQGHDGVLCLIRVGLIQSDRVRYQILEPGRLLHVRLLLEAPVDLLCTYQWAWNPAKAELQGKNRVDELVKQRRRVWQSIDKWLGGIPQRSTCLLVGDFNSGLTTEDHICGRGVPEGQGAQHQDQSVFQEVLRTHRCCALNTWSARGKMARTYLPPHANNQQGTQIDFVIHRTATADPVSRSSGPFMADFVPTSGCRHLPVRASVPRPHRPKPSEHNRRLAPKQVQAALRREPFAHILQQNIQQYMQAEEAKLALEDAEIAPELIQAVMLIHHCAKFTVTHCGMQKVVSLYRGLRQGCGLAPTLWSLYSGWLLKKMHRPEILNVQRTNTSYADDLHYAWTIREGRDLEKAYEAMKYILTFLAGHGLTISPDKTVIVLELQGAHAAKALDRYVVQKPQGKCFRFMIHEQPLHLKIVSEHVYLGAVIGFRKFEQATVKHRLTLARNTFSRLGVILRNRSVPLKLRLQLWQGCVWPTLLHALDCTGLPLRELQQVNTQLVKQARSVANSHSMLTKETNEAFIQRLKLTDPVRRLQNAITQREALDQWLMGPLAPGEAQLQWRTRLLKAMFERRERTTPTELMMATQELNLLRSTLPMDWTVSSDKENPQPHWEARPAKWQRPSHKGGQPHKGRHRQGPKPSDNSYGPSGAPLQARGQHNRSNHAEDSAEGQQTEIQELKTVVGLLSSLVIRHEAQQTIQRQDTGFMVFIQTRTPENMAQALYQIGQQWHSTKQNNPDLLKAPMRVVLYQHFIESVKEKFTAMMKTPSSRSMAEGLGWITADGSKVHGLRWDTVQQQHVRDETVESLTPQEIIAALD